LVTLLGLAQLGVGNEHVPEDAEEGIVLESALSGVIEGRKCSASGWGKRNMVVHVGLSWGKLGTLLELSSELVLKWLVGPPELLVVFELCVEVLFCLLVLLDVTEDHYSSIGHFRTTRGTRTCLLTIRERNLSIGPNHPPEEGECLPVDLLPAGVQFLHCLARRAGGSSKVGVHLCVPELVSLIPVTIKLDVNGGSIMENTISLITSQ